MNEEYTLVAKKRSWVPEWLWRLFCIPIPVVGGIGVIQPFRFFLTVAVSPQEPSFHPQCIWCEGNEDDEHHLEPDCREEDPETLILACRHCEYFRPMTEDEADADWEEWEPPTR